MDVHGWMWSMKKVVDGWISSMNGELNYMNYHMKTLKTFLQVINQTKIT
jgi:hypothetical protein